MGVENAKPEYSGAWTRMANDSAEVVNAHHDVCNIGSVELIIPHVPVVQVHFKLDFGHLAQLL